MSHDHYSHERPGAVYAVPVRSDVATTQEEFHAVHVSYHMERTHGTTTKDGRMAAKRAKLLAKRAKLLDELIAAIPTQQIQRAFVHPTPDERHAPPPGAVQVQLQDVQQHDLHGAARALCRALLVIRRSDARDRVRICTLFCSLRSYAFERLVFSTA